METELNSKPFEKIVQMMHSITKIDIRLMDEAGHPMYQIIDHTVPAFLDQAEHRVMQMIHEVLQQNEPNRYCHYADSYGLEYVAAGIWLNDSFRGSILVGPVLSSVSVMELIKEIISNNRLPVGTRKVLEQFYQSLPILSDVEFNNVGELLAHLCIHHHIDSRFIALELPKPTQNANLQRVVLEENRKLIEKRYDHQNKLMDAITKGNKVEVNQEVNNLMTELVLFSDRVPGSPIRSSKNIGFVLNTMCRIAAEKGGVHPVYLHNMSERFAIMIEKANTIPNLMKLFLSIANEYCDLVMTTSGGQYSTTVKNQSTTSC